MTRAGSNTAPEESPKRLSIMKPKAASGVELLDVTA
jgi:hypothetical protein